MITVTRDSGANVKILKVLERKGLIRIVDVLMENGRENKKVEEKIKPIAVWGKSRWDEAVWADEDTKYTKIRYIIGFGNIGDAMHLEAHIRSGNDRFITEDTDFLNKRSELFEAFGCKVQTPSELASELDPSPH